MNVIRILTFISLAFVLLLGIGTISASADLNNLSACDDSSLDDVLSKSNTIIIEADKNNPNQILNPKIQNAIDEASPGDTLVLNGTFYHCHFLIDKKINIIGAPGTYIAPCPHFKTEGAGSYGVFYITENGSGSTFKGITFINNARSETPFAYLIRGASDITISDCSINYPETDDNKFQGIVIENSKNIKIYDLIINNTIYGIKISDSSNISITDSIISNGLNPAVSVIGNSSNINIKRNSIKNNKNAGIMLESANNVAVENNQIRNNGLGNDDSGSGIYVNTNITKLTVKGNIFIENALHAIMYDYRCRNLNNEEGADLLTDIDNNYFEGHSSMVLHHRTYVEREYGNVKYDAKNDVYGNVGEGNYVDTSLYVYMKNALIFMDVPCGFTYYTTKIPWNPEAPANGGKYDFYLKLSLKQTKNGVYQVSIVDSKGNVASDFNSIVIPVFLNNYSTVAPQKDDLFRNVVIKNGMGTADFRENYSNFKSSGNVVTAVFPGISQKVSNCNHVQLNVSDSDIPIDPSTRLIATKLTTYPLSDKYMMVKLINSNGKPIYNQKIIFRLNGKTYSAKTNSNGIAKVKVVLSSKKTYSATLTFAGNDDYKSSKTTVNVVVKTGSKKSKIVSSDVVVKRNAKNAFQLKLASNDGKALKSQKVVVKVNGKTYTVKTNTKGIAKLSIKLAKVKKYKISMNFLGNADYKSTSKTCKITVVK